MLKLLVIIVIPAALVAQVDWVIDVKNKPFNDSREHRFTRTSPSSVTGNLSVAGLKTVTITKCPLGVNGTNTFHEIAVHNSSGGFGEKVLISGGTCTSGAASGTLQFTTSLSFTGTWSIRSATDGAQEAIWALPATGGTVQMPAGTLNTRATISIGNGFGTTDSTRQHIQLIGAAKGSEEFLDNTGGTDINYQGPTGEPAIWVRGPIRGVRLAHFRVKGNLASTPIINMVAMSQSTLEELNLNSPANNGMGIRLEAVPAGNGNSNDNNFRNMSIRATNAGASCIKIGLTAINSGGGNFGNQFDNIRCVYHNDVAASVGLELGWADNNLFRNTKFFASIHPGGGWAIKLNKQAPPFGFMPSEIIFEHVPFGCITCPGITGEPGDGGIFFVPAQTLDSSAMLTHQRIRGFYNSGEFFSGTFAFRQRLGIIETTGAAPVLSLRGFLSNLITGTVSTVGTTLTGVGTTFTTQLSVGGAIYSGTGARTVTGITSNTAATIDLAFPYDLDPGSKIFYQTIGAANARLYPDANFNIETTNDTPIAFNPFGTNRATIDSTRVTVKNTFIQPFITATASGSFGIADNAGNLIKVNGTTTITSINNCNAANEGRKITLVFTTVLLVTDGGNLNLNGDLTTANGTTLSLLCSNPNWVELGRSVN